MQEARIACSSALALAAGIVITGALPSSSCRGCITAVTFTARALPRPFPETLRTEHAVDLAMAPGMELVPHFLPICRCRTPRPAIDPFKRVDLQGSAFKLSWSITSQRK